MSSHILDAEIDFHNGYKIRTGELISSGAETIVSFKEQNDITQISVTIKNYVGEKPGFTEIEIYEDREKPNLFFIMKEYRCDEKNNMKSSKIGEMIESNYFKVLFLIARIKRKLKRLYKNG